MSRIEVGEKEEKQRFLNEEITCSFTQWLNISHSCQPLTQRLNQPMAHVLLKSTVAPIQQMLDSTPVPGASFTE